MIDSRCLIKQMTYFSILSLSPISASNSNAFTGCISTESSGTWSIWDSIDLQGGGSSYCNMSSLNPGGSTGPGYFFCYRIGDSDYAAYYLQHEVDDVSVPVHDPEMAKTRINSNTVAQVSSCQTSLPQGDPGSITCRGRLVNTGDQGASEKEVTVCHDYINASYSIIKNSKQFVVLFEGENKNTVENCYNALFNNGQLNASNKYTFASFPQDCVANKGVTTYCCSDSNLPRCTTNLGICVDGG